MIYHQTLIIMPPGQRVRENKSALKLYNFHADKVRKSLYARKDSLSKKTSRHFGLHVTCYRTEHSKYMLFWVTMSMKRYLGCQTDRIRGHDILLGTNATNVIWKRKIPPEDQLWIVLLFESTTNVKMRSNAPSKSAAIMKILNLIICWTRHLKNNTRFPILIELHYTYNTFLNP